MTKTKTESKKSDSRDGGKKPVEPKKKDLIDDDWKETMFWRERNGF